MLTFCRITQGPTSQSRIGAKDGSFNTPQVRLHEQNAVSGLNTAHAAAKKANKPVILEEFGLTGETNKTKYYPIWVIVLILDCREHNSHDAMLR